MSDCAFDLHHIFTDPKEPLVPPRFLERFSNRKVKQGASITLSVKVEGLFALLCDRCNILYHESYKCVTYSVKNS